MHVDIEFACVTYCFEKDLSNTVLVEEYVKNWRPQACLAVYMSESLAAKFCQSFI